MTIHELIGVASLVAKFEEVFSILCRKTNEASQAAAAAWLYNWARPSVTGQELIAARGLAIKEADRATEDTAELYRFIEKIAGELEGGKSSGREDGR